MTPAVIIPVQAQARRKTHGWVTASVEFDSEADACFIVLGLGPRVEVLEPAHLRARVAGDVTGAYERLEGQKRGALRSRLGAARRGTNA